MAIDDLANRMKERRTALPALESTGVSSIWLMGIGILLVFGGAITIAVTMGPTMSGDYRTGGTIALIGIGLILRGMFRTRS